MHTTVPCSSPRAHSIFFWLLVICLLLVVRIHASYMEFVASEWSGTDFVASDWTDTALFTSEFLAARLSTLEVCVGDLYYRVGRSYGGESRLLERDQLYGHAGKVSQSKLRRLRAKRLRYRLWSTAQGPDSSCLVHAGICAPRYYRNFCSDDSEEEEWVEHTDTQVQDAGTYTVPPLQFPANGAHINSEVRFSSTNLGVNAGAAEPIPRSGSRWFKGGSRELAVRTGVAAVHVESHSQLQDAGVQTVPTARVASKLQVSQDASERDCEISLNAECHFASELECEIAEASTKVEAGTKVEVGNQLCEEECRGEYQCTHTWTRDATDSGEKDRAVRAQPQSRDPTFAQKSGISDPNSGDRPKEPTEAQSLLRSAEASTKVEVGNQMCEEEVEEECDGIKEEDHSIRVNPNVDPEEFRRRCEHTQAEKTTPFSRNGSFSCPLDMGLLLRARARLREGKATGWDGISASVLKALPWEALRHVLVCFQRLYQRQIVSPDSWRRILVSFMLKGPKARSFDETRALAMLSVFGKWFSCCLTILLESHLKSVAPSGCQLYGFVVGHKCYEVTAPLKHLARHAVLWKEEECHMVSCDVQQAFDNLTVRSAVDSLLALDVDPSLVYAMFESYAHNVADLTFQQCSVEGITWDTCIRTGSMEAPAVWVAKSLCMLAPVVSRWRERGLGVQLSFEASSLVVNHWLWADNVILVAATRVGIQQMMSDLTVAIRAHGFSWKPSSLEYLACGVDGPARPLHISVPSQRATFSVEGGARPIAPPGGGHSPQSHGTSAPPGLDPQFFGLNGASVDIPGGGGEPQNGLNGASASVDIPGGGGEPHDLSFDIPQVTRMIVLGTMLDISFLEHEDIKYRLAAARQRFWTDRDFYESPLVPMSKKFNRYDSRVRSSFLYGIEGTTCDATSLTLIHVEEGKFLSAMCRRRKRAGETWAEYWSSRYRHARMLLLNSARPSLVQLTLYRQWLFAKYVVSTVHGDCVRPRLEDLSTGVLSQEPPVPDILCSTPIPPSSPTPIPPRNRRQRIGDVSRAVRQRTEGTPPSLPDPPSQPPRKRVRRDYQVAWPTASMQSALCMLHASGEYTEFRDAQIRDMGAQGRRYMRRNPHRVTRSLQPWFSLFELLEGLHWDQVMSWTEQGWRKFLTGTLREMGLFKILEFCLIRDVVSGQYRQEEVEEGMTDDQKRRELERKSKRLAALNLDETRWRFNPECVCMELRGDSQCVTRWLTGRYKCSNEIYARTIASMQNRLYSLCTQFHISSPETGRDIWKWVYREGNDEADHETHLAREGQTTSEVRWNHNILNSVRLGHVSVLAVRGSFDGGRCEIGTSCGWVIDLCISSSLSSAASPPGLPTCRWQLGVARRAFMIPSHCTITQAELAASENLLSGVSDLCTYILADSCTR